jgi:TRAP-type transport system periplasmic protein
MKRRGLLLLLSGLFVLAAYVAPSSAQVIKLTLADQNADIGWGPVHATQPWAKKIEEQTKGKVKIEIYPSQTLSKGPDIWNAVKTGLADTGWCFHGYWADMTPLSDVITLPSLPFTTAEKGSEVLWKLYEKFPAIQKEYKDVQVLTMWASSPYFLITTKKQVKTLEEIKGMKIRVVGGPPTEQMKALGASPTLIPMPDTYLSMDRGVIDGMGAPWEAIHGFRLYEVVKYYTMVPLSAVYFTMSMNKAKWDSLPKDVQEVFMKVGGLEGAKFFGKNFYDTAEGGVEELIRKGNYQMTKHVVPPEEAARWRKMAGEPLWEEWVKRMESKGRPEAKEVLAATLEMLK